MTRGGFVEPVAAFRAKSVILSIFPPDDIASGLTLPKG